MSVNVQELTSYYNSFEKVWGYFQKIGSPTTYEELASLRFYSEPSMLSVLREVGFTKLPDTVDLSLIKGLPCYDLLGLETKTGRCLLEGRFVFPVRDMLGNILALIGWYPDEKKYITTPSKYFHRSSLYFGLEQVSRRVFQDRVFICEGIFDALSLRSLGFVAYATMGVSSSKSKQLMYSLFGREIVGVSDMDRAGLKVRKGDYWSCHRYLAWYGEYDLSEIGEENLKIKDVDDLVKLYDTSSARSVIIEELDSSQSKVIKLRL